MAKGIDTLTAKVHNVIKKTGDLMIGGFLTLYQDPVLPLHAVTKQYVDGLVTGAASGLDSRHVGLYQQSGVTTAAPNNVGLSGLTVNGTVSLVSDTTGMYINYASGVGLGSQAGYSSASNDYTMDLLPEIIAVTKTGAAGTDVANCRIWVGMSTNTGLGVAIPANYVGFRFNPIEAADTNWQALTSTAGSVGTLTDTGVAVAADTRFVFRIVVNSLTNVSFYINDVLKATHTTNFPASLQGMTVACYCINASAGTARNFRVRRWQSHMR